MDSDDRAGKRLDLAMLLELQRRVMEAESAASKRPGDGSATRRLTTVRTTLERAADAVRSRGYRIGPEQAGSD